MAKIWSRPTIDLKIALEMNEDEARALVDIMSYNVDSYLKIFKEGLGKSYIEKHEKGLRSLFETSRQPLSMWLSKVDEARIIFDKE